MYVVHPLVIENLTHEVNLGLKFLTEAQMKIQFGTDPQITDGDGMKISMVNAITMSTTTDPSQENQHHHPTNVNEPIQAQNGRDQGEWVGMGGK